MKNPERKQAKAVVQIAEPARPQTTKISLKPTTPKLQTVVHIDRAVEKNRRRRGRMRYTSSSLRNLAAKTTERSNTRNGKNVGTYASPDIPMVITTTTSNDDRPISARSTEPNTGNSSTLTFEDLKLLFFNESRPNSPSKGSHLEDGLLDDQSLTSESEGTSTFTGDSTMWDETQKILKYAAP